MPFPKCNGQSLVKIFKQENVIFLKDGVGILAKINRGREGKERGTDTCCSTDEPQNENAK